MSDECELSPVSSRTCERGTRSCEVRHASELPSSTGSESDRDSDSCDCIDHETAWERIADGIRWLLIWVGIGIAFGVMFYGCSYLTKTMP